MDGIKHDTHNTRKSKSKNMSKNMRREIRIGTKIVGDGHPCFVIAEIGMNHNGDLALAKQIIDAAIHAGVDAIKFQMFTAETLVTQDAQTYGNEDGHLPKYQQEMYKKYELSKEQYITLRTYCETKNILFFASVFDEYNADMLEAVGTCAYKIASCDLTHLPLLRHIARKGKPIIMSTGMATLDEVHDAVNAITSEGNDDIVLLHCISSYPAQIAKSNLRVIETLRENFPYPIGYSDHTPGGVSAVAAITLGASVVEKHLTTSKKIPGVDHHLSMEPHEMREMIENIHLIEQGLGTGEKIVTEAEQETRIMARRSIIAKADIPAGAVIVPEMLVIKRPGTGMAPKMLPIVLGKRTAVLIKRDTLINEKMLAGK